MAFTGCAEGNWNEELYLSPRSISRGMEKRNYHRRCLHSSAHLNETCQENGAIANQLGHLLNKALGFLATGS